MARTFETKPCSRCGGSGRYLHGSMCYGCSGKGSYLTKAGKAAYEKWSEIARPTVAVEDLVPGDKLRVQGFGKWYVVEVEVVEPDELNPGTIRVGFVPGGGFGGYHVQPGATFQRAKTKESHRAAWDAMDGLAGIVEKEES